MYLFCYYLNSIENTKKVVLKQNTFARSSSSLGRRVAQFPGMHWAQIVWFCLWILSEWNFSTFAFHFHSVTLGYVCADQNSCRIVEHAYTNPMPDFTKYLNAFGSFMILFIYAIQGYSIHCLKASNFNRLAS